jgi:acetyltransferase EpsM
MKIAIIGGGDHALEVLNYIIDDNALYRKISNIYIIDKSKKNLSIFKKISKKIIFSPNINKLKKLKNMKACISFGDPNLRKKSFLELKKNKIKLFSIIHKSSYISRNAILSDGVIVAPYCVIAPFAKIKENVLINSGAIVGHHSLIGLHAVMSPNAFTAGHSKVGTGCLLGPNSSIIQSVSLGNYSRLSASSVLYKNCYKFSLAHGNPAKAKKFYKSIN